MQSLTRVKTIAVLGLMLFYGPGLAASPSRAAKKVHHHQGPSTQGSATVAGQSQTLLPDGKVLLVGGEGPEGPLATVIIKDARSGKSVPVSGKLRHPRAWHTATLLPNGLVLIFGGTGMGDAIVQEGELFDLATQTFQDLGPMGLTPRAYHTATVLTDGRVLFAGGSTSQGEILGGLEVWSYRTRQGQSLSADLITPRYRHTASLLADGTVLFWGGEKANGSLLEYGEIFDPKTNSIRIQASQISASDNLQLEESKPENGATDVPVDAVIAMRFTRALLVESVSSDSVFLSSPQGDVAAKVVPAEAGMLAFVTPAVQLDPDTFYTLTIRGAIDTKGLSLPDTTVIFTTAGQVDGIGVIGSGSGGDSNGGVDSTSRQLPSLQAPPGVTAIAGQVLQLNGRPLQDVTLRIGSLQTKSDGTGRFLLKSIPTGHQVMVIDGGTASNARISYGLYEDGVDIAAGTTNVLSYKIWMTELDMAHAVTIPSPTTSEAVIKTPMLPGLELHIPANTVITDENGKPVTQISITPIPIGQPPFPLPSGVKVPVYFTIQPGAAYIKVQNPDGPQGAQLYYPNSFNYPSRTVFDFWNYDADQKGWYVYGHGAVNADRTQVIPNSGVVIYEFTGAMVSEPTNAPANGSTHGNNASDGEPVDLGTGLFVYTKTDLVLPDVIPIVLTRTYRPNDPTSRAFGVGTSHPFDMFLVGDNNTFVEGYTYQDLILADGSRVHFTRTSPCTDPNGYCGLNNPVFTALSEPTSFYGATVTIASYGNPLGTWVVTKKDGTLYYFPDSDAANLPQAAAVNAVQDRYGNTLMCVRDTNHNLTRITSPNGRWIQFTYDTSNRITQAQDNAGRTVIYNYDPSGRLQTVTDANSGLWTYGYDSNNNMTTIKDPRNIQYLQNFYDANGRVYEQIQADNSTYQFSYTLDANGNVTQTNVTDPRGFVRQVAFNSDGFTTSDTRALGKPEQQTVTYVRQPTSGLITSSTDALGRQSTFSYDAMGNLTSVTRLAGTANAVTTTLTYTPQFSELATITDPLSHTTSFSYDNKGNLITLSDPLGNTATVSYNSAGQPVSVTDPAGNTTQLVYDNGDLIVVTDPLSRTTNRFVDALGRLGSVTDPLGRITKFAYNLLNQITTVTDAQGNQTSFGYDPNGNLQSVTDSNGHATQYTYDNMDRVQTRKDALQSQESYVHDGNGNVTQFTDRRGKVVVFSYDGLNRITFAGYGMTAGPTYESTVNYTTYDAGNRLTQVADSIAGTITRGYDGLDRLTSEAAPQGTVSYTFDNAGRRASLTVPGQAVANYTFDNANRLTQITQGSTTVSFGYDNASRRTTLTLPNGVVTSYSYDGASQLAGMTYQNGSTTLGNLAYSYDLLGRRASVGGSFARTGLPLSVNQTAYNANNQLTTWGTANLFYDLNGNMTSDGTHSYTWDARNRLKQIDLGNTASFTYDPFGRRATKSIVGTTTTFLYEGANAVQEVIGGTSTANSLSGGIDEVFQRTDSAGARSFLTDPLGSTLALTDSTGTVQTSYSFEPFGSTTTSGSVTTNSFAYTGRELDATGLDFFRARYYSPTLQRFASEDPIGFNGGGINLYGYSDDSPTNLRDPSGRNSVGDKLSWSWNFTKSFFNGFSLSGRKEKILNSCAASLSQDLALNKLPFVPKVVGSNTFGDIAGLLTGPEPGTDPAVGGSEAFDQKAAVTLDATEHFALVPSILKLATSWDLVSEAPTGLLTFTPETIGSLVVPVVNVSVAAAAEAVLALRVLWDAGVYVGALYVCSEQ